MKLLSVGLAVALLATATSTTHAATATSPELQIMTWVNRARATRGLVPLRSDPRLWGLADDRAAAMAALGVLSHGVAGSLQEGINERGIRWYGFGEVIAYSTGLGSAGAEALFRLWASSPPHWELLMSGSFNYLGIGLAPSGSVTFGSMVLTESRDRTGARAAMVKASVSGDDIRWSWRGSDPLLQSHTAGLRDFAVQQRTDRGSWVTVMSSTASTARTVANRVGGHWYGLRVRARDRAGNVGPWSAELRAWVP